MISTRLSSTLRIHIISSEFKDKGKEMAVPNHNPPQGMEGYDFGALSPEQQEKLNNFKVSMTKIISLTQVNMFNNNSPTCQSESNCSLLSHLFYCC